MCGVDQPGGSYGQLISQGLIWPVSHMATTTIWVEKQHAMQGPVQVGVWVSGLGHDGVEGGKSQPCAGKVSRLTNQYSLFAPGVVPLPNPPVGAAFKSTPFSARNFTTSVWPLHAAIHTAEGRQSCYHCQQSNHHPSPILYILMAGRLYIELVMGQ